jgi:hypothetical protein
MAVWSFFCYDPSPNEREGFHAWYDSLSAAIQAEVDRALDILSRERNWTDPSYKDLEGACDGLGEIRIDVPLNAGARRTSGSRGKLCCLRILGFANAGRKEFNLLVGFEKRIGSEYSIECPKAQNRKRGVQRDENRAPPCEFP